MKTRALFILCLLTAMAARCQPMSMNDPGGKVFASYATNATGYTIPLSYFHFIDGPNSNTVPFLAPITTLVSEDGLITLTGQGTASNSNIGVRGGATTARLTCSTITLGSNSDWVVFFFPYKNPQGVSPGTGVEEWWGADTAGVDGFFTSNSLVCLGFGGVLHPGTTTTDLATSGALCRWNSGAIYFISKVGTNVSLYTNGFFASFLPTPTADMHLVAFGGGSVSFGSTCNMMAWGVNSTTGLSATNVFTANNFVATNKVADNMPSGLVLDFHLDDASTGTTPTNTASTVGGWNGNFSSTSGMAWTNSMPGQGGALRFTIPTSGPFLDITNSSSLRNGTNCSWVCIVRDFGTNSGHHMPFSKLSNNGTGGGPFTQLEGDYLHMFVQDNTGATWLGSHGITLSGDNGYHMAVGTFSANVVATNSALIAFIDGNYEVNDDNSPGGTAANQNTLINWGASTNNWRVGNDYASEGVNAAVDEPRVYDHPLSGREVWAIYMENSFAFKKE